MNLVELPQQETAIAAPNVAALMLNPTHMQALVQFAELMADSVVMVPKHLHGKPADCLAVALQAAQWGMNPFVVAQKTHVVNGGLGYEAQLVNAVLQASGEVRSRPHYDYRGEGNALECRVGFVLRGEEAITWNEWLKSSDIQVKNSPLWKTNPRQQLGYLQVKNWARAYVPQAILGIRTVDDLLDAEPLDPAPTPQRGPRRKSEAAPVQMVEEVGKPAPAPAEKDPEPAPAPATPKPTSAAAASSQGGAGISGGQVAYLRNKLKSAGLAEQAICDRFQVANIELLNAEQFDELKSELLQMG